MKDNVNTANTTRQGGTASLLAHLVGSLPRATVERMNEEFKRIESRPAMRDVFPADLADAVTLAPDWEGEVTVGRQTAYKGTCPCCAGSKKCYTGPQGAPSGERAKPEHWTRCRCVELDERVKRVTRLGLTLDLRAATWGMTDTSGWPSTRGAMIRRWIDDWEPRAKGWVFFGNTGVGKSHIAALMGVALAARGVRVAWFKWPSMIAKLDGEWRSRRGSIAGFYRDQVKPYDVVIFDDVGAGEDAYRTAWAKGVYEEIIGNRAESFKTTILTTNLDMDTLDDEVGHRVTSRLRRVTRFASIEGTDRRAPVVEAF